jgi:hypothetical protein
MQKLQCQRVLYPYETRILFLLMNDDRLDTAREIGQSLRETNVAVDCVFTAPASHRIGSEFLHSLMPKIPDDSDEIIDIDLNSDQAVSLLEEKACEQRSDECQELLKLIPSRIKRCSGCHTFAVAPGRSRPRRLSSAACEDCSHVAEYIIDQRTGHARLHWLM